MTYIEKLKKKYPMWGDAKIDKFTMIKCPMTVFKENRIAYCCEDHLLTCDECWQQECKK